MMLNIVDSFWICRKLNALTRSSCPRPVAHGPTCSFWQLKHQSRNSNWPNIGSGIMQHTSSSTGRCTCSRSDRVLTATWNNQHMHRAGRRKPLQIFLDSERTLISASMELSVKMWTWSGDRSRNPRPSRPPNEHYGKSFRSSVMAVTAIAAWKVPHLQLAEEQSSWRTTSRRWPAFWLLA